MNHATNIAIVASLPVIGNLSPYSYQVRPKTYGTRKFIEFDGEMRVSRLTKGAGRGSVIRYYAYFLLPVEGGETQHWIELTAETYNTLDKDPASVLKIDRKSIGVSPDSAPAEPEVAAEPAQPKRSRKAKREAAEAV